MTWYTFGTVAVYDAGPGASDKLITGATGGKMVAAKNGTPIPIRDLNGTPITEITSNSDGQSLQFQAEVLAGLVQFGDVTVTVWANEVGDLVSNSAAAVTAAQTALASLQAYVAANPGGGGGGTGVTDHGALSGLSDDDHTQYLTPARGDVRYFTQAQVTTAISNAVTAASSTDRDRGNHFGSQTSSSISDLTEAVQDILGAMVAAAGGAYNDAAGTITLPSAGGGGAPADGSITTVKLADLSVTSAKVVTVSADKITDGTTSKAYLATEKTKLAGVQAGATATKVHYIAVTANNPARVDPVGNAIPSDATWLVVWSDDGTHTVTAAMAHDLILTPGV